MKDEILLIRSGRHLHSALSALRSSFPAAHITVVSNDGSHDVLDRVGIDARDRVVGRWSHVSASALIADPVGRGLWSRRAQRVAVLWPDPDGSGYGNVTRAALALSPRGFLAVTPDGTVCEQSGPRCLAREALNGLLSLLTRVAAFALLTVPARVWRVRGTSR
jgi:hypothetical protein